MRRLAMLALVIAMTGAPNPAPAKPLEHGYGRDLYLAVIKGLRDTGKPMAALAYLDDFEAHYPGLEAAVLLRADCLADAGELESAEPLYRRLAKGPHADAAEAGIGRILARRGDWDGAADAYAEALKRRPADVGHLNDLGFALIRAGRPQEALRPLRQAAELAPDETVSRNNLALALARAGRDGEARALVATIKNQKERAAVSAALTEQ